MANFSVILASNSSTDIYPENSLTKFINVLPRQLQLNSNWAVALQAISFDNKLCNLPPNITNFGKNGHFRLFNSKDQLENPILTIDFENIYYDNSKTIQNIIKKQIPQEYLTYLNTTIRNKKLHFIIKQSVLQIDENVFNWLKLHVPNQTKVYYNNLTYIEIDARKKDVVVVSNKIFFNNKPNFIKIKISEIKPCLSSKGMHQNISIIPYFPPTAEKKLYYHEITLKEYFYLSTTNLHTLSVNILDDRTDKEPNLTPGQPTFLKLLFKKMSGPPSFLMRLNSNDSKNIFPENTAGHFRAQLPHAVELDGVNWEVALMSINFPSKISPKTYFKSKDFWFEITIPPTSDVEMGEQVRITVEEDNIKTLENLVTVINEKIVNSIGANIFSLFIDTATNIIKFQATKQVNVEMSPLFALIIGDLQIPPNAANYQINFPETPQNFICSNFGDLNRCLPNNILIYCDFIVPSIMGEKYLQILKFIPNFNEQSGKYTTYQAQNLDFTRVSNNTLDTVKIELRDAAGNLIHFVDENLYSYVNLLFKKL